MPTSGGESGCPTMSAVPRWSHRDPVEGGNPYRAGDLRHPRWEEATARALAALKHYDAELAAPPLVDGDPSVYAAQWLDLAMRRFDTWAQRGLAAVHNAASQRNYGAWLDTYVANWRVYVAETCPHVTGDVRNELTSRLQARTRDWTDEARRLVSSARGAPAGAARPDPRP